MQEHGSYEVERFDAVVLSSVSDAWNEETMRSDERLFKDVAGTIEADRPWALVVDARAWCLATPEVGPRLAELSRWKEPHGMVAAAYVNDDSDIKRAFAESQIAKGYLRAPMTIVDYPDAAFAWIEGHGFEIPSRLRARV